MGLPTQAQQKYSKQSPYGRLIKEKNFIEWIKAPILIKADRAIEKM